MEKLIFKILCICGLSYFSAKTYLYVTYFIQALYTSSKIADILPFTVVLFAIWILICIFFCFLMLAIRKIQFGLDFIIIISPMSALPFIVVGTPQAILNHVFICRSSIIVFALILSISWLIQNFMIFKQKFRFPFLSHMIIFIALYSITIFTVDADLRRNALNALFVMISIISFFYFFITWIKNEAMLIKILKLMAISCILQGILSFLGYFYYVVVGGSTSFSFTGLLRDYELFAEYLAIHIPIIFYLIRNETSKHWKTFFKFGLFLVIFVLIATVIRGAIAALFIAMFYYFIKLRKVVSFSYISKTLFFSLFVSCISLLAVYQFLPESARIVERFMETDLSTGDSRRFVWLMFFSYFREKPFLGYGMFYDLPTAKLFWPHSTYFYYLLTIGIAGLANFLVLLLRIVKKGWENLKIRTYSHKSYEIAIALNSALIVFIIDGLKVGYQRYSNYQLFIWMLFGLIVAFNFIEYKNNHELKNF